MDRNTVKINDKKNVNNNGGRVIVPSEQILPTYTIPKSWGAEKSIVQNNMHKSRSDRPIKN